MLEWCQTNSRLSNKGVEGGEELRVDCEMNVGSFALNRSESLRIALNHLHRIGIICIGITGGSITLSRSSSLTLKRASSDYDQRRAILRKSITSLQEHRCWRSKFEIKFDHSCVCLAAHTEHSSLFSNQLYTERRNSLG